MDCAVVQKGVSPETVNVPQIPLETTTQFCQGLCYLCDTGGLRNSIMFSYLESLSQCCRFLFHSDSYTIIMTVHYTFSFHPRQAPDEGKVIFGGHSAF